MKYIKTYESINKGTPKIGDWVICYEADSIADFMPRVIFTRNNIGQITETGGNSPYTYVNYFNVPKEILYNIKQKYIGFDISDGKFERGMLENEIIYWSKNKEDLEAILSAKKYNL